MLINSNYNYSQFYRGTERLQQYGSGLSGKEKSSKHGENVIVEFSGDGMAKLLDSQKKVINPENKVNIAQTTDPVEIMRKNDSKAYEEYLRLRNEGKGIESNTNAFKYLVKWYGNQSGKITDEAIKVELSNEGLKVLTEEEKSALLQESLEPAQQLHRIEPGSDIRSKYGYISAGELMKENAPEEYEKYSAMLTEAFEKDDRNLLLDATKYMLDWQSEFEKGAPIFQSYEKFGEW